MAPAGGRRLGSAGSRERIRREHLVDFYKRYYTTRNISVVAAGAVTAAGLDALLDRAVRLPPALKGARPPALPPPAPRPLVDDHIRAPFMAVVFGYALEEEDRQDCPPMAELIERRLLADLVAGDARPVLRDVEVACVDLRGRTSLLALGYTRTLDAPDLHRSIQRAFDRTATLPATRAEQQALERRRARRHDRMAADPAALADLAARAAEAPAPPDTPFPALTPPPVFPSDRVRRTASRAFVPDRQFQILFSPLEN